MNTDLENLFVWLAQKDCLTLEVSDGHRYYIHIGKGYYSLLLNESGLYLNLHEPKIGTLTLEYDISLNIFTNPDAGTTAEVIPLNKLGTT